VRGRGSGACLTRGLPRGPRAGGVEGAGGAPVTTLLTLRRACTHPPTRASAPLSSLRTQHTLQRRCGTARATSQRTRFGWTTASALGTPSGGVLARALTACVHGGSSNTRITVGGGAAGHAPNSGAGAPHTSQRVTDSRCVGAVGSGVQPGLRGDDATRCLAAASTCRAVAHHVVIKSPPPHSPCAFIGASIQFGFA
jgi:hypothetical protein